MFLEEYYLMKTLKLFATLRDIAGQKELEIPFEEGQTVRQLIADITDVCPALGEQIMNDDGELSGLVHILIHGRHVHWMDDGLDSVIRDKDQIVLIPPAAGG
jgi:MoaD family protein